MRKLHGFVSLLIPGLFVGLICPQANLSPAPSPLPTPQSSQPAPDALAAIAQRVSCLTVSRKHRPRSCGFSLSQSLTTQTASSLMSTCR